MHSEDARSSPEIVARYFDMWNSGDSSIAEEILSPAWVDHAHPEVTGPRAVQQAIERIRVAQPDLRFRIDTILGDGGLVAVVGTVNDGPRLIWLIQVTGHRMTEMWTYHDTDSRHTDADR